MTPATTWNHLLVNGRKHFRARKPFRTRSGCPNGPGSSSGGSSGLWGSSTRTESWTTPPWPKASAVGLVQRWTNSFCQCGICHFKVASLFSCFDFVKLPPRELRTNELRQDREIDRHRWYLGKELSAWWISGFIVYVIFVCQFALSNDNKTIWTILSHDNIDYFECLQQPEGILSMKLFSPR